MPLVEVREQGLDARAERPPGLQPGRIGAPRLGPAVRTGRGVLPALDHHWLERGELDHLAPSEPAASGLRQLLAAASTDTRAGRDHHVRLAPHPADADVPT